MHGGGALTSIDPNEPSWAINTKSYSYDFGINCTLIRSMTIINWMGMGNIGLICTEVLV